MTRGESIEYYIMNTRRNLVELLANIERGTCESCKHYSELSLMCYKEVSVLYEGELPKDFGCNMWEAREEANREWQR